MGQKLRVLLVEDHHIFRDALETAMSLDKDIIVVGSCSLPEDALAVAEGLPIDVAVVDLEWPGDRLGGVKLIHGLLSLVPALRVVVCSAHEGPDTIRQATQAGAAGYLLKHEVMAPDVVRAVKEVGAGRSSYSASVVDIMADLVRDAEQGARAVHPLESLTPREHEVASLLIEELSNAEIARRLEVSEKTVKTHVSSILQKLDLSSRYQVASYMRRFVR